MSVAALMTPGLYLVTPDEPDTARLLAQVAAVLPAAPRSLQYRSKSLIGPARHEQAAALRALCRAANVEFMVNDDLELALAVDADGLHLGKDDGDIAAARARLGGGRRLGVSCYNEWWRAEAAVAAGADHVAFGAMFASPTKPEAVTADIALLTRARDALGVGVVAIGGITLANAPQLIAAGATRLAVISDVFAAADPCGHAAAYGALFKS